MGRREKTRVLYEDGEGEEEMLQNENHAQADEKSLYELLGAEKNATQQEIKKAYYKLALQLHPDKNPDDEEAKEKFQQLQKVVSILGDEEKRALYDETGCIDDADLAGEVVHNLQEYFRAVYKKVTEEDIEEFAANYRGSDSEKNDLINLYQKCKGNMNRLFCSMICSDPKLDSHRFRDMIDEEIAAGKIEETKSYKKWSKQIAEIKLPTDPLRNRGKPKKKQSEDLYAIISQRRSQREHQFEFMFSSLLNKYGGGEQSSSEPTEEEFEAARKRLESQKPAKKSLKN